MTGHVSDDEAEIDLGSVLGGGVEFDLIRVLVGESPPVVYPVLLGPGDDAAVVQAGRLAISTDLSVEDVHFRRSWISFEEAGYRAVTAAASDLAAMGARPLGVLLSLAVSDSEAEALVPLIGRGVGDALRELGAPLIGGDLTASPGPVVFDVTVLGEVTEAVTRSGAVVGDEIWVTGVLGGSAGAVRIWQSSGEPSPGLRRAFARPVARVREALWLTEHGDVHAMIDLSDGLEGDAGRLAAASHVRIELEPDLVPRHANLDAGDASLALSGGEDYELLIAAPPDVTSGLVGAFHEAFQTPLTRIGTVVEGEGVLLRGMAQNGGSAGGGGFDHFARRQSAC